MPSVAQRSPSVQAQVHPFAAQTPHNCDTRSRYAILPPSVWTSLFPVSATTESVSAKQSEIIAVTFPSRALPDVDADSPSNQPLTHLFAASQGGDADGVQLSALPQGYSLPLQVTLTAHKSVTLTSAIVTTSSRQLLEAAQPSQSSSSSPFATAIAGSLVRQGDLLQLPGLGSARIIQTEPVLQGRIASATDLIVVFDDDDGENDGDEEEQTTQQNRNSDLAASASALDERDDDDLDPVGDFAIDERFLANTVLDDFERTHQDGQLGADDDDDLDGVDEASGSMANGYSAGVNGYTRDRTSSIKQGFSAWPLRNRFSLSQAISAWKARQRTEVQVDEESALLLSEGALAALGAFDGDWAIAELQETPRSRLVRVFSAPASTIPVNVHTALLPPSLWQNLQQSQAFQPWPSEPPRLLLQPLRQSRYSSPANSSPLDCLLPIPFADNLTIARVPSELSVKRQYQPLFLDALREYFEGKKRIVKEGDIFAVGVEKEKVRWVSDSSSKTDAQEDGKDGQRPKSAEQRPDEEIVDYVFPDAPDAESSATGVVHFLVTSLTPELSAPPSEANGDDYEVGQMTRLGRLGAVVDPSLTNMVQTGVVGSQVADWDAWLGVVSGTPPLPSPSTVTPLSNPTSPFGRICQLLQATLLPDASTYGIHLTVLLKGARGSGKKTVVRWAAKKTGVHLIEINCFDVLGDTDTHTEGVLRARFESAASCGPAILLLRNIDALARKSQAMETGQEPAMSNVLRDCVAALRDRITATKPYSPVAVFATASDPDKCPNGVLASFKHEISIEAPSEPERLQILEAAASGAVLSPDVSLKDVATQTAALVAADLVDLVGRARLASVERLQKAISHLPQYSEQDLATAGICLTGSDFEVALSKARANYSESIGAPKIPNVTWDDVGGLVSVKNDILDTIQLPLEHPELFADGLKKRSGILLYGPPGTGKTLLAKAVATSCSLNFFSVKGPELLNMYIGESEANVRRVFQRARDAKPCVIFFDELDSVAPKRGNQGDSGGVMDRIVSQLLAELDGMAGSSEGTDVFVIGATNRPDLLDPALLRPGRFDRMLYLSVSETHEAQLNILQALTRKFKMDPDVGDLSCIANQCPFNLTGADFYALCSDAMLKAMTRQAGQVDERIAAINSQHEQDSPAVRAQSKHPHPITPQYYLSEMATPEEVQVSVKRQDFELALNELVPSVSEAEMEHYRSVQAQFSKPKDEGKDENEESQNPAAQMPAIPNSGATTMQDLARLMQQQAALGQQPGGVGANGTSGQRAGATAKGKGKARAVDDDDDDGDRSSEPPAATLPLKNGDADVAATNASGLGAGSYAMPVEAPRRADTATASASASLSDGSEKGTAGVEANVVDGHTGSETGHEQNQVAQKGQNGHSRPSKKNKGKGKARE